jgi:hypothetical protein
MCLILSRSWSNGRVGEVLRRRQFERGLKLSIIVGANDRGIDRYLFLRAKRARIHGGFRAYGKRG